MPGISELLDSDMEENNYLDADSILSSASEVTEVEPQAQKSGSLKKPKKRRPVTMPKSKPRVTKATSAIAPIKKATKKTAAAKQKAIEEQIDETVVADSINAHYSEAEAEAEEVVPKSKSRGRQTIKGKGAKKAAAQQMPDVEEGMEVDSTPMVAQSSHAQDKNAKAAPKVIKAPKASKTSKAPVQPTAEDTIVEEMNEAANVDPITARPAPIQQAQTGSRSRQEPSLRKRAGSASDTERGDPNLRRKLGDVTRKFENVDLKYRNLKEVGIAEASTNMEKLRRQCETATDASNKLIASLKQELALQTPLAQDARKLRNEMESQETEIGQLRASVSELNTCLATAQNEIKALQAKLAAARKASVEPAPAKTPGSAMKNVANSRAGMIGSAEAIQAAQIAEMKLDLYGDLTGLIVRSVKRAEDGVTYECIQTGRNGTLHFKLFIDQEDVKNASFEETEFLYQPLLDKNRDRDMMELMPPYLTDDITFARQNAAKFYQRVADSLTRRVAED